MTRKATVDEIHQLRSVTQFLALIARQTSPDFEHRISKVRRTFENACVRDLRECNRIKCATYTSTRGIVSPNLSWVDAVLVTTKDSSFGQDKEQLDGITQNFKS